MGGGVLQDNAVIVPLKLLGQHEDGCKEKKVAWDVHVIDVTDTERFNHSVKAGPDVTDAFRDWYKAYNNTAVKCSERGWRYEPIIFSLDGEVQKHAEEVISQLALSIARVERAREVGPLRNQLLREILLKLPAISKESLLAKAPPGEHS